MCPLSYCTPVFDLLPLSFKSMFLNPSTTIASYLLQIVIALIMDFSSSFCSLFFLFPLNRASQKAIIYVNV